MQHMMFGAALLAASLVTPLAAATEACPDYAAQLAAMVDAEQGLRKRIDYLDPDNPAQQKLDSNTRLVERVNDERFQALLARCGWPARVAHGDTALKHAWLLVERGEHHLALQKQALALVEQAAAAGGDAPDGRFAQLYDRVAVAEGRPQHYGTQLDTPRDQPCAIFFKPFDKLALVEARRARLGMGKLYDYLDSVKEMRRCTREPHYAPRPDTLTRK
ncbi:DUF6624 domain-containing protein [Massilia sp. IC2-476]|uniref:DUF6624 domain-containing protein n=1 Tax=Massilia sp. IC2-476 TaxID=2887199 RepID=UPI001D11CEBF|nr:DUF6624 domain-containing protein [Massilia sp. IC2-476]MCC2972894.1 hypothetical protein [Massilia sp. IC2-476]